jgi:hypothetical protein
MASNQQAVWRLQSPDGTLIAELRETSFDMPWIEADVTKGAAWEEYADLLAAFTRATERAEETDDWSEADRLYEEVRSKTVLFDPTGTDVPEYLLHTDGKTASWRWADEPFD